MSVPLLDLAAQNQPLRDEIMAAIGRVVDSGRFILGPDVEKLEASLAAVTRTKHAIGVSSGSDALLVALMALGVGPGDSVITTPFSFIATAGAVARLGAKPVFVDIDPATFNLDPAAAAAAVSSTTKAIIPVHLFGRAAPIPETSVPVIEDAAQSIGASMLRGIAGCLSFFPSKNLGAFGDAGAVYTDDNTFAERVKLLRMHGGRPNFNHQAIGGNFRIDALQAAVLSVKLPHLGGWIESRRRNAHRYRAMFAAAKLPAEVILPADAPGHIYNQFSLRVPRRDALREHLAKAKIGTEIYYPVPFHLQPCFQNLGYQRGAFPHSERAADEALALPIYPGLAEQQQQYVVDQVTSFYASAS
ncbi:MAG: DegT/DnrJ/EryC1/StrS family aminotransferase [Deltaproteobacteria bacterium]|nr:DegT/DnrJ/EryC1/StrS family aminotransferase [Deltaproteobacteria bacterium]